MSTFDNDKYRWRETYFVFLDAITRPSAEHVRELIQGLGKQYELKDLRSDEEGQLESLTVLAGEAYAAVDISFSEGEEVREQIVKITEEMMPMLDDPEEISGLDRIASYDARFDLLHFEQVVDGEPVGGGQGMAEFDDPDAEMDMLDPGALLLVLDALALLCDGVGVDPQSSSVMIP